MTFWKKMAISVLLLASGVPQSLGADNHNKDIQTSIHLLDYISRDYTAAVSGGKIINDFEYKEMLEFSSTVQRLAKTYLTSQPEKVRNPVFDKLEKLKSSITNKAPHDEIIAATKYIKSHIIEATGFQVTPTEWPDMGTAKTIYRNQCASCHGEQGAGDGQLAGNLNVPPTDFTDNRLMKQISPFQAYNTIRLGIEGTSMRGFNELSDKETWALAFYIKSLRFQDVDKEALKRSFQKATTAANLEAVTTKSDIELLNALDTLSGNKKKMLAALRLRQPMKGKSNSLDIAKAYLEEALAAYREASSQDARQKALAAYLEGIEPAEAQLKAGNPEFTKRLEQQMIDVRTAIEAKHSTEKVEKEIRASLTMIDTAAEMMEKGEITPWLSFILSASILLREGVEAFLIIALMLTLIRTSRVRRARKWVHAGWLTAVLLGFAGWFLSDWVLQISGRSREVMEGLVALLAVVILASVGFWLHTQSHAKKWKDFVENKIQRYLRSGNMFGLAFFAFIVVFREAFESVLFLQAINIQTTPEDNYSIGLGVVAASLLIAVFVVVFLKYSGKIPIRPLFRYSAWLITLLAFILIGKGFHAIQEAGWVAITQSHVSFSVSWLGIYPTVETLLAQGLFLGLMLMLYFFSSRRLSMKNVAG